MMKYGRFERPVHTKLLLQDFEASGNDPAQEILNRQTVQSLSYAD